MMNKKGQLTIVAIVLIVLTGLALFVGLAGTIKIVSVINSIPTWGWIAILILFIFLILPKGKK